MRPLQRRVIMQKARLDELCAIRRSLTNEELAEVARLKDRDNRRRSNRAWRAQNRDRCIALTRAWRIANPGCR